jgi:hypothetical protein
MRYYFPTSSSHSTERRALERFKLRLPAKIEVLPPGEKQVLNLVTSNISANAAYFHMLHPIAKDTRVRVTITLASKFVQEMTGFQIRLTIEGCVLRSVSTGIAIQFSERQEIERLGNAASSCI